MRILFTDESGTPPRQTSFTQGKIKQMKLRNVKFSRTFSVIVIIIVVSAFLLPSLSLKLRMLLALQQEDQVIEVYTKKLDDRINNVRQSIQAIGVKDNRLRACIDDEAMKFARVHPDNSGGIDSVKELKTLRCPRRRIKDLSGLEKISSLEYLYLEDNEISDIDNLAGLTALKELNLENNVISDFEPLQNLAALQTLFLDGNRTLNADVLLSLPNLKSVSLPDIAHIFCEDLERLAYESCFKLRNFHGLGNCKGKYSSRQAQLLTKQRLGRVLTVDEEVELLEYELNQMKDVPPKKCN